MTRLANLLTPGTVVGDGAHSYVVEKCTDDAIYLRGKARAGIEGTKKANGALRIIPTVVVEDILKGLKSKSIQLQDIIRGRGDKKSPNVFAVLGLDHDVFVLGYDSTILKICEYCLDHPEPTISDTRRVIGTVSNSVAIPKAFLLLAGLSGTGKTRFVRNQAEASSGGDRTNYCIVAVRPDWHEPSDLLGYVSRIGGDGAHFVVTDLLHFLIRAWQDAAASATADAIVCKDPAEMVPHWLCLDEMNLAPVEQYFADYLSVLETRKWQEGKYTCDPLLKVRHIADDIKETLRTELKLPPDGLWQYFSAHGIPLPPNLIVAGTVNMDETAHGFSRKVIDRAFTIDFGEFYPNDYGHFFEGAALSKTLTFPRLASVDNKNQLAGTFDPDGLKSIHFLGKINDVLHDTPFKLAFRALNELLLAVVCFAPLDEATLYAVWDDFLMTKLLPRIDGDSDKLGSDENGLLTRLSKSLKLLFGTTWDGERADLLRLAPDGTSIAVPCRAKKKLSWMQNRLETNGFTSFWP